MQFGQDDLGSRTLDQGPLWRLLAMLWIAAFFSYAPLYLSLFIAPAIRPVHWMYALGLLFLLVWLKPPFLQHRLATGLAAWIVWYAAMCLVWYSAFGGGDLEALRQRIVAMIFLLVTFIAVSGSQAVIRIARKTILGVVLLAVAINAYDISHPFVMIPVDSELAVLGRAAGLYANPNQAGAALILGFILTVGVVSIRWRASYVAYVGTGVVLTLSRAAILGFLLAVVALWFKRLLSARQIMLAMVVACLAGWALSAFMLPVLTEQFDLDPAIVLDRLLWILDPQTRGDFSQAERVFLATKGWEQFLASPFVGNGIGSTELWAERSSTHNVYIALLSDFGLLGLAVVPGLLIAVLRGGTAVPERLAFTMFVLFWGMFSHGILAEYYFLIGYATMATLCGSGPHYDGLRRPS